MYGAWFCSERTARGLERHGGHTKGDVIGRVLERLLALTAAISYNQDTDLPGSAHSPIACGHRPLLGASPPLYLCCSRKPKRSVVSNPRSRRVAVGGSRSRGRPGAGGCGRAAWLAAVVVAVVLAAVHVGPAGAQPVGFGDVSDDAFYSAPVASLADRGVFAGTECEAGFCPDDVIDRQTMAVWLVRVLDGADPTAVTRTRFGDVDASGFYARFIERMADLGLTTGCGDGLEFCPEDTVTRAQMAVFLSRAYGLADGPDPGFSDVSADAWFAADVARLTASGITAGCGDGTRFCPGRDTTRGQMATFLHRAEQAQATPRRDTGIVRVLYATPTDRQYRAKVSDAIGRALVDVQSWFRQQLDGLTFSLGDPTPEHCELGMSTEFYLPGTWGKVVEGTQHCAPVEPFSSEFVWVIYADVPFACNDPGRIGAALPGLVIVSRFDVEGVTGELGDFYDECGRGPWDGSIPRWKGGISHEIAHGMHVPHPPGCETGEPGCDASSVMWLGYLSYPDTYLGADDKEVLIRSPFISDHSGGRRPGAGPRATHVRGSVVGLGGAPIDGALVSLTSQDLWAWARTGPGGAFEIAVPDGSDGTAAVSVHANEAASCRWLGYLDPSGGLTTFRKRAMLITVGDTDVSDVDITLPGTPEELCSGQRTITGTVLGPDREPVEGIFVGHASTWQWGLTGPDGAFKIHLPEHISGPSTLLVEDPECGHLGHYGPNGFTNNPREATRVWIGGVDLDGITIALPASVETLCPDASTS